MRLSEAAIPKFKQHGTFAPRYGWLRKAHRYAKQNPQVFSADDAPVQMGVGKNMVLAIRFWGLASKVVVEQPGEKNVIVPTCFGEALFGTDGWDPYLEDPASLWLTHWAMFSPPCRLPVWWYAFNSFTAAEFSDEDLRVSVRAQLEQIADWTMPAETSIKSDVAALLLTYAPYSGPKSRGLDDRLECPLRQLSLIGQSAATGNYRFATGVPASLKSEIATAIVLDYIDRVASDRNTITFGHLAGEPGAPGRALRLTEAELIDLIRPQTALHPDLDLLSPTGTHQLAWNAQPAEIGVRVLNSYYSSHNDAASLGPSSDDPCVGVDDCNDDLQQIQAVS